MLKKHYAAVKGAAGIFVFTADAPMCLTKSDSGYNWTSADGGSTFRVLTQDGAGKWHEISNGKAQL